MDNISTQRAANIAKIGLIILWLAFMYSLTSCGSSQQVVKSPTQKYYDKVIKHRQYAIVNNQIIIFENNY
jgi:hypothetical protein